MRSLSISVAAWFSAVCTVFALLLLAGCGPTEQETNEEKVGALTKRFYRAMAKVDLEELHEITTGPLAKVVERAADDENLREIMRGYGEYTIELDDVDVFENDARIDLFITREPARLPQTVVLEPEDGEWKISSLEYDIPTLRSGYEFVVEVLAEEAVDAEAENQLALLNEELELREISVAEYRVSLSSDGVSPPQAEFTFLDPNGVEVAQDLLDEQFAQWSNERTGSMTLKVSLIPSAMSEISSMAVEQTRLALQIRICDAGLPIPAVVVEGDPAASHTLRIHLPGIDDVDRLKQYLFRPGRLSFHMVVQDGGGEPCEGTSNDEVLDRLGGSLPQGTEIVSDFSSFEERGIPRPSRKLWYVIDKTSFVDGRHVTKAENTSDNYGQAAIAVTLNDEGAERLKRLTRANIDKMMAIVLDGKVLMAANIEMEVGSEFQITGHFTSDEAMLIARLLRTHTLPAPIRVMSEREIPAELEW